MNTTQKKTNQINDDSANQLFNNKELYKYIKKESNYKFKQSGLYKDAYIIKKYISHGGTINDNAYDNDYFMRVINFIGEKWIDVDRYINDMHICDIEDLQNAKNIRPMTRISVSTPITINEIIKMHGKRKVEEILKQKNETNRIIWRSLKCVN